MVDTSECMEGRRALVFGINWPSWTSGTGIALRSSLRVYADSFESIHFVGLADSLAPERLSAEFPKVRFSHIPVHRASSAIRFARSLLSVHPACTSQFLARGVKRTILRTIDEECRHDTNGVLIFEHLHPTVLLPLIRKRHPRLPVACRSYDVLSRSLNPLVADGRCIMRMAWKHEIARMRRLERRTARLCDAFWAITSVDAHDYEEYLGIRTDGVFGVAMDCGRYAGVTAGHGKRALHIGGSDLRKAHGLGILLDRVWPQVHAACRDAELLLAGRGCERFDVPDLNVRGLGFVEDDREFLARGRAFINPQIAGSGIKLKSLVAMAAGKVLISTNNGVRGIAGTSGTHFIECKTPDAMASALITHFSNPEAHTSIAEAGHQFIKDHYGEAELAERASHLLEDFCATSCGPRASL